MDTLFTPGSTSPEACELSPLSMGLLREVLQGRRNKQHLEYRNQRAEYWVLFDARTPEGTVVGKRYQALTDKEPGGTSLTLLWVENASHLLAIMPDACVQKIPTVSNLQSLVMVVGPWGKAHWVCLEL